MASIRGEFRAFSVDNGISLVLVADGAEQRLRIRPEDNAVLYEFLAESLSESDGAPETQ